MKKGQVAVFMILGVILAFIIALAFYANGSVVKSILGISVRNTVGSSDTLVVVNHAQSCLKLAAEDALLSKIGFNGGYLDADGDPNYGDLGAEQKIHYNGYSIPVYIDVSSRHVPELGSISTLLSNYIAVEFEQCFASRHFADIGINLEKENIDYSSVNFDFDSVISDFDVNMNEEDVTVAAFFPVVIRKGNADTELSFYNAKIPVRLKLIYGYSVVLVDNILAMQPNGYDISADCGSYDESIGVDVVDFDATTKVIRFADNSQGPFIYQFAVRNVDVVGSC